MKKIFLFIFFLVFFAGFVEAQYAGFIDERLTEVFPEEYLNRSVSVKPDAIKYLNWELDNSHKIVSMPGKNLDGVPYLRYFDPKNPEEGKIVESVDNLTINIYKYYFKREMDSNVTYRIGDSGDVIVFYSHKTLLDEYNIHTSK